MPRTKIGPSRLQELRVLQRPLRNGSIKREKGEDLLGLLVFFCDTALVLFYRILYTRISTWY